MRFAIGIGFYEGALLGCLFIFCVITVFHRIDVRIKNRMTMTCDLYIEMDGYDQIRLLELFHLRNLKMYSYEITDSISTNNNTGSVMLVWVSGMEHQKELVDVVGALEGAYYVYEIN